MHWILEHVLKPHGLRKGKTKQSTIYNIRRHWEKKHNILGEDATQVQLDEETLQLLGKVPALEQKEAAQTGGFLKIGDRVERWGDYITTIVDEQCSSCCTTTQHTCSHDDCKVYICNQCYD